MTHASEPNQALAAAAHLIASFEAARRIRGGENFPDVARYVRIRAEKLAREHARLFASIPNCDPIDFARGIEPLLGASVATTTARVRVVDGVEHRFMSGTGWVPPLPMAEVTA